MRKVIVVFIVLLLSGVWLGSAQGSIARGGGGARPQVGNRSAGGMSHANMKRGNANRTEMNRNAAAGGVSKNAAAGKVNRNAAAGEVNKSAVAGSVNKNAVVGGTNKNAAAGVNRSVTGVSGGNVNAVNVNRSADVHGWGNNYWVDDNHWNWGSFAGGAAAGATGAAIGAAAGAAAAHPATPASAAPAMGTVVTNLPPTCAAVPGQTALYDCGGAYYRPSYEGSNLVYQAVAHP